jgi:hypothetical protein
VWAISGEARHGDKGSPSSEQMMEAFFLMELALGFALGAVQGLLAPDSFPFVVLPFFGSICLDVCVF